MLREKKLPSEKDKVTAIYMHNKKAWWLVAYDEIERHQAYLGKDNKIKFIFQVRIREDHALAFQKEYGIIIKLGWSPLTQMYLEPNSMSKVIEYLSNLK